MPIQISLFFFFPGEGDKAKTWKMCQQLWTQKVQFPCQLARCSWRVTRSFEGPLPYLLCLLHTICFYPNLSQNLSCMIKILFEFHKFFYQCNLKLINKILSCKRINNTLKFKPFFDWLIYCQFEYRFQFGHKQFQEGKISRKSIWPRLFVFGQHPKSSIKWSILYSNQVFI